MSASPKSWQAGTTAQAEPPALASLAPAANAILATHTEDPQGMCAQCRAEGCLTPHPCSHHRWASEIDRNILTPETLRVLGMPTPSGPPTTTRQT